MAMNRLDNSLAAKYQANGGGIKGRLKTLGNGVMSAAKGINKVTGGEKLSKYFGEKLAKMAAKPETKKYVSQTVSGKDALKSAGKVALSVASVTGAGAAAKGVAGAVKGVGAAKTKSASLKRILKKNKKGGDSKILDTLKKSDGATNNPTKTLPVKRNPLDMGSKHVPSRFKSIVFDKSNNYKGTSTNRLHMTSKRDLLKDKLDDNRWKNHKTKHLSKNEKGDIKRYFK